MRDLQRVIACLHMDKPEDMQCSAEYLAKVAQSSGDFGARVTVPMSAQSGWRQGFDLGCGYNFEVLGEFFRNLKNYFILDWRWNEPQSIHPLLGT